MKFFHAFIFSILACVLKSESICNQCIMNSYSCLENQEKCAGYLLELELLFDGLQFQKEGKFHCLDQKQQ